MSNYNIKFNHAIDQDDFDTFCLYDDDEFIAESSQVEPLLWRILAREGINVGNNKGSFFYNDL